MLIRPHDRVAAYERGDIPALALDATASGEYAIVPLGGGAADGGFVFPFRRWLTIDEYNGYVWCSSAHPYGGQADEGMYRGIGTPRNGDRHRIVVASPADAAALIEALTYAAEGRLIPPMER